MTSGTSEPDVAFDDNPHGDEPGAGTVAWLSEAVAVGGLVPAGLRRGSASRCKASMSSTVLTPLLARLVIAVD